MHDKPNICGPCGGKCCKSQPGSALPSDFGLPGDPIILMSSIASGYFCIDWWEGPLPGQENGDLTAYYVRPSVKGHDGRVAHAGWGGECSMLEINGCSLPSAQRPNECRRLVPKQDGPCLIDGKKGMAATAKTQACVAWLPYNDLLKAIIKQASEPEYIEPRSLLALVMRGIS